MSAATRDPVLQWTSHVKEASGEWNIPASILAAQIYMESRGIPGRVSSANAKGLTQFIPSTAATYNVNTAPGGERSQIFGAARYLTDLGFQQDPRKAIASYAAGPGNWNNSEALSYADELLRVAKTRYAALDSPRGPGVTATGPTTEIPGVGMTTSSGEFLGREKQSQALYALLWVVALVAGAAALVYGLSRATGVRNPLGAVAKAPGVPG